MSVLTGPRISRHVSEEEDIAIVPYDRAQLNPASYDLRLGDRVSVYEQCVYGASDPGVDGHKLGPRTPAYGDYADGDDGVTLHVGHAAKTREWVMSSEFGWVLKPGVLYLIHTLERVRAARHAVVIDGKSSLGRLGVSCHQTAGYGDPGYDGQYTLEVTAVHPVRVFPGMRFCQARFVALEGEVVPYAGRYVGDEARGPVASRAWEQCEEDARRKG